MTTSTRREMLRAALGLPLLASCDLSRRTPIPDGDLLDPGMALGHALRDAPNTGGAGARPPRGPQGPAPLEEPRTDEPVLDVIVVGGGVAGLSAAWRLRAAGIDALEVIELADVVGGTARTGSSPLTPFPWGAHYVTAPLAENTLFTSLLDTAGIVESYDALGHPIPHERWGCREPDERLFADGMFHESLAPPELLDDVDRRDLARFEAIVDAFGARIGIDGRPAFAMPRALSSKDPALLALDTLSFADWLAAQGLVSEHLRWLCEYAVKDDDGVSLEHASAWAGLFYFCARRRPGVSERPIITAADGNGFLVRYLAKGSEGKRSVNEAVVDVRMDGDLVIVVTRDLSGTMRVRRARRCIVAAPRFIAGRIVRAYRDAPPAWMSSFTTSPWVVANVHLRDRPRAMGVPFAWDSVFLESKSLGFVDATHQRGLDHGPTVWTWYMPLTDEPNAARARLLSLGRSEWADACMTDLSRAHPDIRKHVDRVDICRWGHAMVRPTVGLFTSGALEKAQVPVDAIHFAHTDLSGMALFEEALFHGVRAAEEALAGLHVVTASQLP